jgi:hypothetical protein
MSEETAGVGKQRKRSESKSKIDWTGLALQTAAFAGSALLSGFCMAAGGHAYTTATRSRGGISDGDVAGNSDGSVIAISRKNG